MYFKQCTSDEGGCQGKAAMNPTMDGAAARAAEGEVAPPVVEPPTPAVSDPQVRHAGLSDLPGRRRPIQIFAPASDEARHDAGAVSPEVESPQRLSHRRVQLRGATIRIGEKHRARAIAQETRRRRAGKRRHDRGGCTRASYRRREQGQEEGGRNVAAGRSETQTRSPT
jgi:hypothetical protein